MSVLAERVADLAPRALVTLGSGLGGLAEEVDVHTVVGFDELGLPSARVPGHTGRLLAGHLAGIPVLVQQGRIHLYEGHDPGAVVGCVRVAADAGVPAFVVTNAAGGLAAELTPGDLMLVVDHLNLTGASPLEGPSFVDLEDAYDPQLRALAHAAASASGEELREGVYAGLRGPAYETPAEIRMLRTLGADAVGMSTVLEVIAARERRMRVAGFSVITNVHRPGGTPTDHREVLDVGREAGRRLAVVIRALLARL